MTWCLLPVVPLDYDLTAKEAADLIGVHDDSLKRWANEGLVRGLRTPGGHWRFRRADLEAFIESRVTGPESAA